MGIIIDRTNKIMKVIIRKKYLDFLIKLAFNNKLIKVLSGQRRAGKSYILRQFIDALIKDHKVSSKNIFYVNFEDEEFKNIKNKDDLSELIKKYTKERKPDLKKELYLILDEIQEITGWEKLLASYLANTQIQYQIYITGSNSNLLSSELATYITGRYIVQEILPFSYQEFLDYYQLESNQTNLIEYLNSSSLPETFHLNKEEEIIRNYLKAVKDSILLKDIVQRYKVENVALLENLFLFLIDNISNPFSINSINKTLLANNISTNINTLSNYIKYLEESFVLHGVSRYDLKGKKILEGEKKYYLNDLGLRKFLFSKFDLANGKFLENFVYNELRYHGFEVYTGKINDLEIDFVAEKNKKRIYIQVAYLLADEKVIQREFGNLQKIKDNWDKIVISLDPLSMGSVEGIEHKQAWDKNLFALPAKDLV
ncbi:MAG: ATP-binding protein [Candidatus Caenarcaniphilales bacterium]|nr:ATP-binding protein [Candidatus Caenarcaniphilales bacterium]